MSPVMIGILLVVVVGIAGTLIFIGLRQQDVDPLEERLADFIEAGELASLTEIELSQSFVDRMVIPAAVAMGELALKFTPQKALQATKHKIEMAGNPNGIQPTIFFALRIILAALIGGGLFFTYLASESQSVWEFNNLALTLGLGVFGFYMPDLWLTGRVNARQKDVRRSLPDALDLLTICVEAGLGFEASMKKVAEKWETELALAFGRALKEIQLGKLRREALRDMADRIGADELDSFVAAVIQSEQLGVSMAKILRIQSDDMRIKRRQRAEAEAQTAPIKMLIPMLVLIFPTIMIVLMVPAVIRIMNSGLAG